VAPPSTVRPRMGAGQAAPETEVSAMATAATTQGDPTKTLLQKHSAAEQKVPEAHISCSKCGNKFLPDAEFCRKCGELRPAWKQSTCYCGNSFEQDEAYCRKCGADVEVMLLLVKLKMAAQERLRWRRDDDPFSFEAWNVNAKLESEFAYMHSLLSNRQFVEVVRQEFDDFDGNKDAALDQQEVAEAVPKIVAKHGWQQAGVVNHTELARDFFKQMDRDSDSKVSKDEFLVYIAHFNYMCYQSKVPMPEIFFYGGKKPQPVAETTTAVVPNEAESSCCKPCTVS